MAGKHIGPYTIHSSLGAGGMGEVYRAHDDKLGRDVALKLLPRELSDDPDHRARLLREARAAAALNHPNICTIHDVGEADGLTYIAMEVIEGQPLSARLAERALPVDEILRIGVQLAEAVAHAHDRGIVHRDLKSANVMVTPTGHAKVLDFGLAKRVGEHLTEAPTAVPLTRPLTILGTLPYMSPEQLRGQPVDAASDVWALGVILYEMAAGVRPFGGRTEFEISAAILNDELPPLPSRVPPALQTVIGRCLEKERARRYQRAGEVRAALETARAAPLTAVPGRGVTRPPKWVVGTVAAVATLSAAAAVWWRVAAGQRALGGPGGRIQSIAVLPLDNRSGDAGEEYFVAGMHEALITDLAHIGLQKVIAKPSADAFKGTNKPLHDIGQQLGVDGLVTGSVTRVGDRIQIAAQLVRADTGAVVWANRYERSGVDVLSLQNDVVGAIAREVRATLTPEQKARLADARPVNAAAHDAYLKGRSLFAAFIYSTDRKQMDAALAQFEHAEQIDPAYAPPYVAAADVYLTASQMSLLPPAETMPKARAAAARAVALDDRLSEAHAALGEVNTWYEWDWSAADREIRRALELNPDSVSALRASEVFLTLVAGKFDEAARTSRRLLSVDPLNPFSRVQPIWVAFFSRRHDESIRHAQALSEVWPGNIMSPFFLASNYAVKRMTAETVTTCGELLKSLPDALAVQTMGVCAWAYATVGQIGEARRVLELVERRRGALWLDPAVIAQAYGAMGDTNRAIEWARKGLEERSPLMIYLKASAMWDSVRGDPRFQAIVQQMNFPQ
jgi:eukaryotic-like serine/threonine-protein kinase